MPLLSIVTVCYNAEKTIETTLKSVIQQTFTDFEYIIIDGKSTDNTLNIIRNYEKPFTDRCSLFKYISESDQGIYDAMNKGAKMASGKWVLFLNADDSLYSGDVLEKWSKFQQYQDTDIIYGDCQRINGTQSYVDVASDNIDDIKKGKFFCHQAAFTKREYFDQIQFNPQFKICADYDFFLKLFLKNARFSHINEIICNYSVEGTSNHQYYKTILENYRVRINNGINRDSILIYLKAFIWSLKHTIRNEW